MIEMIRRKEFNNEKTYETEKTDFEANRQNQRRDDEDNEHAKIL